MCAFNPTQKVPGVYIQPVDVEGPIRGVATSIAAFVGPARKGPIGVPTAVSSFVRFNDEFGDPDFENVGPYITKPRSYTANAVEGFFANGGALCYFVRVATSRRSWLALKDTAGNDTLVVRAKKEGKAGDNITVEVRDSPPIAQTKVARGTAPTTGAQRNQVTLAQASDADKFIAGDDVTIEDGGANPDENGTVADVSGTTVTLVGGLNATFGAGTIRTADLAQGGTRIRVERAQGIDPGANIELNPNAGAGVPTEIASVQSVESRTGVLTLASGLANDYDLAAGDVPIETREFSLVVSGTETFDKLSIDPRHSRYFAKAVKSAIVDVEPPAVPNPSVPPADRPAVAPATKLQQGADDDLFALGASDFTDGIDALKIVDEVTIVCVPDRTDQTVQQAAIDHCRDMQDRFAVLDPRAGTGVDEVIRQLRGDPATGAGALSSDRGWGAIYYPWISITDPLGENGDRLLVPPSGHIAGLYSRVDDSRGVSKAPANEPLTRALDIERQLNDADMGRLNETGVNVIRTLRGRGVVVWGARTIAPEDRVPWRYINVRRLVNFLSESIAEATAYAVFEPNDRALWEAIKRQVTAFLTRLWTDGALFGATPEDAFRVRIDDELNPPELLSQGVLTIEVIVCPTTPAEYIVFQIMQRPNGPVILQ